MVRVTFLGGVRGVTGSSTLLEKGSLRWLIDCGMYQGGRSIERRNLHVRHYRPTDLSFILLTHAHIDHSGLIPKLFKEGFRGKVICTRATLDLCEVMLKDSGHIQEMESEWQDRKNKRSGKKATPPLYTVKDAEESLRLFYTLNYNEIFSPVEGIRVRFQDAGHILGSAIVELWVEEGVREKKIVFSGDLGGTGQPIVRDPTAIEEADILWLESTYGNRFHKSREETVGELLKIIKEAMAQKGKVIIPAFAVGRTQDVIYTLNELNREGLIPIIPIYIDSPLAISATEIFKRNSDLFDKEARVLFLERGSALDFPGIQYTRTAEESKAINEDQRPGIIISASGMCDSGRIKHHLKHHLWREESHIVFVGYQAAGTIGRRIVDGARSVKLFGEEIAVKARIHTLGGFSAHTDQKGLLAWVSQFKNPGLEVFVNHGEEKVSMELAKIIQERFQLKAMVPQWKETKTLFGLEERIMPAEGMKEMIHPRETFHHLFRDLDRNYKKLRRKLKKGKGREGQLEDPRLLKQLEEINQKIEELDSGL